MALRRECSFCGKAEPEVARLHEGPRALICNECVALCIEIFEVGSGKPPPGQSISCSFCGATGCDRIVAGPTAFVCDTCVGSFAAAA